MAAGLRRAPLVVGMLAATAVSFRQGAERDTRGGSAAAADFVPGSTPHRPHVQVRPAISNMPSGHAHRFAVPGVPTPPRRAHIPAMQAGRTGAGPQPQAPEAAPEPAHMPLKAAGIVDQWMRDAAEAEAGAASPETLESLAESKRSLAALQRGLAEKRYDMIFALAAGGGSARIHEIAAVTKQSIWDNAAGTQREIVAIGAVAARPSSGPPADLDVALVRRIIAWAAATGRLVTITSPKTRADYFRSIGFEPSGIYWRSMVYFNSLEEELSPSERELELITIEA